MPEWVEVVLAVGGALLVGWLVLIMVLWIQQRRAGDRVDWRQLVRLVPDVIRLIRRLVADPAVPRRVRWGLVGLLGYLLMPIDLVPDVIPVLGYADDVIIVLIALRWVIRRAGPNAVERHWPGTEVGLASLLALTGEGHSPRDA